MHENDDRHVGSPRVVKYGRMRLSDTVAIVILVLSIVPSSILWMFAFSAVTSEIVQTSESVQFMWMITLFTGIPSSLGGLVLSAIAWVEASHRGIRFLAKLVVFANLLTIALCVLCFLLTFP